ncbi:MAG: DUF5069 domain-containing protein [Solirubrobacteraceae bacterium]
MTERPAPAHPAAKNLAHEDPEPMDAELAGYPWLPRMIDKARASHAGTLGTYYRYPCPIDAACLELLGIDAATFRTIANRAVDDQAVIEQLATIGANVNQVVNFDPAQLNAELHRDGS